jgi:hypothetical protein
MKSGKRSIPQKMLNLPSLMNLTGHSTPLKHAFYYRIYALGLAIIEANIQLMPVSGRCVTRVDLNRKSATTSRSGGMGTALGRSRDISAGDR